MSECTGLRCDRCGVRTLAPEQGPSVPDGWSVIKAVRHKPFHVALKDLCPACTETMFAALAHKETQ